MLEAQVHTVKQLGHFRILDRIGAGGMGEVYRAHDEKLRRDVAIKLLPADRLHDATGRARLLHEARAAAALNHPHICVIHDVGEAEGQAYIAMECVNGVPLSARLEQGPLAAADVVRYGIQLADALEHAHERNIIHRDLKPANVIVTPEDRIKVLDFGLAKRHDQTTSSDVTTAAHLTEPGAIAGTPAYMAPEVLRGAPADPRSDIWAMGVILYEMVSGKRPFAGRTWPELNAAILTQTADPLPKEIPGELRAIIERCLAKEPADRYRRAGEVRAGLEAVPSHIAPRRVTQTRRSVRRWIAAAAFLIIVFAFSSIVLPRLLRPAAPAGNAARMLAASPMRVLRAPGEIRMAVLPFENATGDARQEYFSDGLTEEVITEIGRVRPEKLTVIARTSAMRYKNSDKPLDEIARELAVDYLLIGSVRHEGPPPGHFARMTALVTRRSADPARRIRVGTQLVRVADQAQLWAESYERDLSGAFSLQAEIAREVGNSLPLVIAPVRPAIVSKEHAVDPASFDELLKGRRELRKMTREGIAAALKHFERALELDPANARACAAVASVWIFRQQLHLAPSSEATPKARAWTLKALKLDPELGQAHGTMGTIRAWSDWDWSGAEQEYKTAFALDPSLRPGGYSHVLAITGRPHEGLAEAEIGAARDPYAPIARLFRAVLLRYVGKNEEAIAELRELRRVQPRSPAAAQLIGALHEAELYDEALVAAKELMSAMGAPAFLLKSIDEGNARGGYPEAMRQLARTVEKWRSPVISIPPNLIAELYFFAGEQERALDWFEKALEERNPNLPYITLPMFDSLRPHPRFQRLLREMNLPPTVARPAAGEL